MKRKNLFSIVLVLVLCSLCILPVGAVGQAEKVDLGDGCYMEVYVVTDPQTRGSSNTSGSKTLVVYNASDDPLFSLTVHGTFVFNGTTATAVSASYSYDVQGSSWGFSSGKAYCSGNSATAEGTFAQFILFTRTVTVTLSCTPDGVLY